MSISIDTRAAEDVWQLRAACKGPNVSVFFPPATFERKDEREQRERRAKSICQGCAVRKDCLAFALRTREPHGIWGGLSELERKALLGPV